MSELDTGVSETATACQLATYWSPKLATSLVACLVGTVAGTAIIHSIDPYFPFADLPDLGISPSPELVKKFVAAQYAFHTSNLALNLAVLGLCVGLFLGLVTPRKRRIMSGIAGGMSGALGGAVAGYFIGMLIAKAVIASADQSLVESSVLHFASWAGILVLISWSVGCVQDGVLRAFSHGLVGILVAILVAVAHNVISSAVFPNSNLLTIIPASSVERMVWCGVTSIVMGLGFHYGLKSKPASGTSRPSSVTT